MTNKKSKLVGITVAVVALICAAVAYWGMIIGPPIAAGAQASHLRQELLCKCDHRALLDASRALSKRVMTGELSPATYWVRSRRHAEVSDFPEVILSLRPAYVSIAEDGVVRIELGSRWGALGVYAYPDGYEKRFPNPNYGDHQLMDGLWYYDDNYLHVPDYATEIDTILRGCGR